MKFKAVFQKINLNWSRKLTHNLTLPNVEFRTSWCTTRSQNPSFVYSTPSELSAILCEPCSQKSRFFSGTAKFYSLYAGAPRVPPRSLFQALGHWGRSKNQRATSGISGERDPIRRLPVFSILHWPRAWNRLASSGFGRLGQNPAGAKTKYRVTVTKNAN